MKGLFKLSTLAVSVLAASQVSAIELYNAEGTELTMYGAVAAQVSKYDYDKSTVMGSPYGYDYNSDVTHVEDPGSYVGFDISHTMGKFKGVVKLEFDVNFNTQSELSDDALSERQTYVGFGHEDFGTVTIGRQASPYMKTDKGYYAYWVGGLNMMQSDELGSRRSQNTVVWQNDFDNLYIGLQYQAARTVENIAFGNGLNFGSLLLGTSVAEVGVDINGDPVFGLADGAIKIDSGYGAAIAYTFDFGTYIAAAYNQANDINGMFIDTLGDITNLQVATDAKIMQYALAVEHHFMEGAISVAARYEHFESEDNGSVQAFKTKTDNFGIGANFYVAETVRIYGGYEYAKDDNELDGATKSEATIFNLGTAWAPVPWGEVYLEAYRDDVTLNGSTDWTSATYDTQDYKGTATNFFLGAAVFF